MDKIYELYQQWYAAFAAGKSDRDSIWLEFNHKGGGYIMAMHHDYDESPDPILFWGSLQHGIWMINRALTDPEFTTKQYTLQSKIITRVVHRSTMAQMYVTIYNYLEKGLDSGAALQEFLQREDVIDAVLEHVSSAGWELKNE